MTGPLDGTTEAVEVVSGAGRYPVLVGAGLLDRVGDLLLEHAPAARYAIISDSTVGGLYGESLAARLTSDGHDTALYSFPAGEASKTRKTWSILTDQMLDDGHGRDSCVLALGGGVSGDLGGFVAATYLRGLPVVQLPTSYLAMIDASVGGKTGVDVRHGKNLVGAFHPPKMVVADVRTLRTLPRLERVQGLVEAFKHGAIRDEAYFHQLCDDADVLVADESPLSTPTVVRSVRIKAEVVSADEREGGLRQILNFGHTIGHALEAASDFAVGHGTAVAAGMLLEAELGERLGVTAPGTRKTLDDGLGRLGLDFAVLEALDRDRVMSYLAVDKKARAGRARYVLLAEVGRVSEGEGWSHTVSGGLVAEVLEGWR